MEDYLDDAEEELKRANHLLFVSLKYTRTVGVFRSLIQRLINTIDNGLSALLYHAKEQGKIDEVPTIPKIKCDEALKLYPEEEMKSFINFYLLLRLFNRTESLDREEYRRHVTMSLIVNDELVEVNIDNLNEYYKKTEAFVAYIKEKIHGKKDD